MLKKGGAVDKEKIKNALLFGRAAICDAIYLDDGLDGAEGERTNKLIDEAILELARS